MFSKHITVKNELEYPIYVAVESDINSLQLQSLNLNASASGGGGAVTLQNKKTVKGKETVNAGESVKITVSTGDSYVSVFSKSANLFFYVLYLNKLVKSGETLAIKSENEVYRVNNMDDLAIVDGDDAQSSEEEEDENE